MFHNVLRWKWLRWWNFGMLVALFLEVLFFVSLNVTGWRSIS